MIDMLNSLDAFLLFKWPANVLGIKVRWFFPQLALLKSENYPREYELRALTIAEFWKRFSQGNVVFPSLRVNTNAGDELTQAQKASRKGKKLKIVKKQFHENKSVLEAGFSNLMLRHVDVIDNKQVF
jgi:hypothetical protein